MVTARKFGWMGNIMRVNGKKEKWKVMARRFIVVAIFMKVSRQPTNIMVMESTLTPMDQNISVSGKTIKNMVKDLRIGLMEKYTKASTLMERNTVKEN